MAVYAVGGYMSKHELKVGNRIELFGGYDYDPIFLSNPPAEKRFGKVIRFIKGQNNKPAAVVKLNEQITGRKITGNIVVLELRYVEQNWSDPSPVHIELCDFFPDDKEWKDRRQGEWIEAAATLRPVSFRHKILAYLVKVIMKIRGVKKR